MGSDAGKHDSIKNGNLTTGRRNSVEAPDTKFVGVVGVKEFQSNADAFRDGSSMTDPQKVMWNAAIKKARENPNDVENLGDILGMIQLHRPRPMADHPFIFYFWQPVMDVLESPQGLALRQALRQDVY